MSVCVKTGEWNYQKNLTNEETACVFTPFCILNRLVVITCGNSIGIHPAIFVDGNVKEAGEMERKISNGGRLEIICHLWNSLRYNTF